MAKIVGIVPQEGEIGLTGSERKKLMAKALEAAVKVLNNSNYDVLLVVNEHRREGMLLCLDTTDERMVPATLSFLAQVMTCKEERDELPDEQTLLGASQTH